MVGGVADLDRKRICASPESAPGEAILACTALIDGNRSNRETLVFAHFNRAVANNNSGNPELALQDLNRVIRLKPDSAEGYGTRGVVYGMSGDLDAAGRDFQMAVKLDPKDKAAMANLASTYERRGDLPQALEFYDKAVELDPEFAHGRGGRCWVLAASNQDLDKALADCNRALALNPQDFNTFNSRAFVHYRQGHYEDAIMDYDRAIGGAPNVGSSFYVRGLAKRAMGNASDGDTDVEKGLELEPGVAKRYAGFGVVAQ